MITFITDQFPGEPDILTPVADRDLTILDALEGVELRRFTAPKGGWTHELLIDLAVNINGEFDVHLPLDAQLGGQFVGSTEV